jgi:hypothetical protein
VLNLALAISTCSILTAFRVWWRYRVHRQNVDRVSTMVERVAQQTGQVVDAAAALRAVQPTSYLLRRASDSSSGVTTTTSAELSENELHQVRMGGQEVEQCHRACLPVLGYETGHNRVPRPES